MDRPSRRATQPDALFGCVHEGSRERTSPAGQAGRSTADFRTGRLDRLVGRRTASAAVARRRQIANPLCRDFVPQDDDPSENARSVGMMIGYGRFRLLDLGDLTWNKEHGLACPSNLLGTVDVYLTTHHGTPSSGPAVLVHAVAPRVAVMNNGSTKGGSPRSVEDRANVTRARGFLATPLRRGRRAGSQRRRSSSSRTRTRSTAHAIRLTAYQDGRFSITNARNGHSVEYKVR